ncbi:ubiquitin family protein [Babesia bovis T2Bo]|uniref:Ubiquitin family protein n=1 Tax=Babesia bovis TaxID=5865 RepID=A7APS7_BABBO|nr:ubiquitin family protein [Babesia bovis T2Bo]EDO08561.1 ubiquitin family protein [Babesia bovis T2Bo]BAN65174.1 ubiquitin family protein [Babesia bovis]|eukprot:XP_001612129.1 ubiquitin family protein [Babesia bovis T2Bo]
MTPVLILLLVAQITTGAKNNDKHIHVRTLNGSAYVPKNGIKTAGDLAKKLERQYGVPVGLYSRGERLDHCDQLVEPTVDMLVPLRGGMTVQVQTMLGQKIEVEVDPNDTVLEFKKKLSKKQKLPVDQQRIIYQGKMLQDHKTLAEYNIQNNAVIHMVLRLRGG